MFPVCGVTEKDVANRFDTYTRTHAHAPMCYSSLTNWLCTDNDDDDNDEVVYERSGAGLVCVLLKSSPTLTPLYSMQFSTHTDTRYSIPTRGQSRNTRNTRENMTARRRRLTSRKTTRRASVTSQSISVRKPIRWRMETIGRAKKANWRRWRWGGYSEGAHHGHHWVITACEYTIWVWSSKIVIIITIESV